MLHLSGLEWAWQEFYSDLAGDADYVQGRRKELRALHKMKADDKRVACNCISGLAHAWVFTVHD